MITEELTFDRVNPVPYNPRVELQPGDPEWEAIDASLDEFGQVQGLVWNKRSGNLVAGHQRINVMKHRGRDKAHFTVVDLDPDAEKRLNLILNKVSGRWEPLKLQSLLAELNAAELDLTKLGWTPLELRNILATTPRKTNRDPDAAAPGAPAIPTTKPGDLYELIGATGTTHRLLCGNSRTAEAVALLCGDQKARLVFTDPPYNVAYDNSTRGDGRRPLGEIENDKMDPAAFLAFLTEVFGRCAAHTVTNAPLYTFLASATHVPFEMALQATGWRVKQQLIWAKHFALSRADYHYAHEPLMYAAKAEKNCEWFGPRTETTLWATQPAALEKLPKGELLAMLLEIRETASVWHEPRDNGSDYVHPTQKPIGLAKRALVNSSLPGEYVLDLFAGSGSTAVAAELNGRLSLNMELMPGNCDVIVRRFLETFEGSTATRNGEPYALPPALV